MSTKIVSLSKLLVGKQIEESLVGGSDRGQVASSLYRSNLIPKLDESYGHGWLVLRSCRLWLMGTVAMFWAFLFFDMIGDTDGRVLGAVGESVYLGCVVLMAVVLKRCKLDMNGSLFKLVIKVGGEAWLGCLQRWQTRRSRVEQPIEL